MSLAVEQAFIQTILNGSLGVDIVHENDVVSVWDGTAYQTSKGAYTPTNGRPYIAIKTFHSIQKRRSIKDTDIEYGTYQAIVNYPMGDFGYRGKLQAIMGLFGDTISYASQVINIIDKQMDGGRIEQGFYQVVLRMNFTAEIAK